MLSVRSSLCRLATGPRAWSLSSVSSIGFGQGQDDGPYFQTQTQAMISLKVAIRGSDDKTHSFGPRFISSRSLKTKSYSQTVAVRNRMRAAMLRYRKPEMLQAVKMPVSMQEMDNSTLVVLSELGLHSARTEVLKRHIMSKDKVNYDKAHETYKIISAKNKENMYLLSLPYHFGILMSLTVGVFSLPMVFHLPTALWFNSNFVTADIPDIQDLETVLEVGAWTWNWM